MNLSDDRVVFSDLEQARCPLCNCPESIELESGPTLIGTWGYVLMCAGCGSSYRYPGLDPDAVSRFYAKAGIFGTMPGLVGMWKRRRQAHRRISLLVSTLSRSHLSPLDAGFLEVGAGIGLNVAEAQRAGFGRCVGLEPRKAAVEWAQATLGVEMVQGLATVDILRRLARSVNDRSLVVFASHVLEHIPDLARFMGILDACRSLDRATYLFVEVPCTELELDFNGTRAMRKLTQQHMTSFSLEGLSSLLAQHGWRVVAKDAPREMLQVLGPANPLGPLYSKGFPLSYVGSVLKFLLVGVGVATRVVAVG